MRNLTKTELKAVDKLRKRYDFYKLSVASGGISNGILLDIIRYAKRLKITN